jgi:hypothetical protein
MPGVVTITGTVSQPRLKTIQQGGVGTTYGVSALTGAANQASGGTDMDYRYDAQKDLNFFQELQQFIAEMCRTCGMTPVAAADHLLMMLAELRRQPTMGERLYVGP